MRNSVGLLSTLASVAQAVSGITCTSNSTRNVIYRDVVVVGGGASRTHAAVKLRDLGKSVAVVEKKDQLGGHTSTYKDPLTGLPFNIGVQGWITYGNAAEFIARMNVSTTSLVSTALTTKYVDFSTGLPVEGYVAPVGSDRLTALETYLTVCEQYEKLLLPGFFDFPSPGGIPQDLTMPFVDFVTKYNISAAVPTIFEVTGMGPGDMMNTATMYVMQAFGAPMTRALMGQASSILPISGNVLELYQKIETFLGDDVFYSSTVISSTRHTNGTGVTVIVQGENGTTTQINAKRLLLAIEPTAGNLAPFDLDEAESAVLSKFSYSNVYAGLVTHPSLNINQSLTNIPAAAAPSNYGRLPLPSFVGRFDYFGRASNLFRFLLVGTSILDADGARALANKSFANIVDTGVLASTNKTLEFSAFADHGAMHMRASGTEVQAGFIQDQYALQGRRSTWWTGEAWSAQFTTVVWAYNDVLLPKLIEGI